MRLVSFAVLLMSSKLGLANCNNLRVRVAEEIANVKLLPHHPDTVCDEDGYISKVWERSVQFYGSQGIGCDLMMVVDGERTRYEFDMNWCFTSPGAIEVEHWEGPHLKYCVDQGTSRLNGDNPGVVTIYGLSSKEDEDELYCPDSDSSDFDWGIAGVVLGIIAFTICGSVTCCYFCGCCCWAPRYTGAALGSVPPHTVALGGAQGAVQYNKAAESGAELRSEIV